MHKRDAANAYQYNGADPDLLDEFCRRLSAVAPNLPATALDQVKTTMRADYGGRRHFLRKGAYTKLDPTQRRVLMQDAVSTKSDAEILASHNISRATLYRMLKRPPAND